MDRLNGQGSPGASHDASVFTIVGGTTISERAAIVRQHCEEGSEVELRWNDLTSEPSSIGVWLKCRAVLGLLPTWKKIGYLPPDAVAPFARSADKGETVVARGKVLAVFAPAGREEAAVSVKIEHLQ